MNNRLSLSGASLTLFWLSLSYLLMIFPLYSELHISVYGCAILTLLWRYRMTVSPRQPPSIWVTNGLALIGCAGIYLLWRQLGFLPAMLNMLVLGCTLKFFEFNSKRHLSLHVLSLFFLCALTFIYHQSLGFTLLAIAVCLFNLLALLSIYQLTSWQRQIKTASALLLQSIPLMVCLFLLLPHLGPMWRLPDVKKATTGLSDSIAPGDIAELSRSSALAFRADFDGPIPPATQQYWRAIVLEQFDGVRWSVTPATKSWLSWQQNGYSQPTRLENLMPWQGPATRYRLIVEPTQQSWLYSLDYSKPAQEDVFLTPTLSVYATKPLQQKRQVQLTYYPQANLQRNLVHEQVQLDTAIPAEINPQTRQLVRELRLAHRSDAEFAMAAMQFFGRNQLVYTLQPPTLSGMDQIDELLFGTRRGFCAHFAGAFTFMMRAAGIPARMVTGYLGGEVDPSGRFVSVYQSNAHAWVEVWLNQRWQRFDPTTMVAPGRAVSGIDDVLPAEETRLRDPFNLASYRNTVLLAQLNQWLTNIDYRWSVWVLNYDNQQQDALLQQLFGGNLWGRIALMLGGFFITIALVIGGKKFSHRPPKPDPLILAYQQIGLILEKRYGVKRHAAETPTQFLQRLDTLPETARTVMQQITQLYEAAQYAGASRHETLRRIKQLKRQL